MAYDSETDSDFDVADPTTVYLGEVKVYKTQQAASPTRESVDDQVIRYENYFLGRGRNVERADFADYSDSFYWGCGSAAQKYFVLPDDGSVTGGTPVDGVLMTYAEAEVPAVYQPRLASVQAPPVPPCVSFYSGPGDEDPPPAPVMGDEDCNVVVEQTISWVERAAAYLEKVSASVAVVVRTKNVFAFLGLVKEGQALADDGAELGKHPCWGGGGAWGDPHLTTHDGVGYDLQSVGEFDFVEAAELGVDVQARFAPWTNSENVSVIDRLAFGMGGSNVELTASGDVLVDGVTTAVEDGQVLAFDDGSQVIRDGDDYMAVWRSATDKLVAMKWTPANYSAEFTISRGVQTSGLLGDFDGNPENDLLTREGDGPTDPYRLYQFLHGRFANSWRVTDTESRFSYPTGEGTENFTDRLFPDQSVTVDDYPNDEVADAEEVCADVDAGTAFDSCVLDILATGDLSFVDAALEATSAPVSATPASFEDGAVDVDFDNSVPSNFRSARLGSDPALGGFAGPFRTAGTYDFGAAVHQSHAGITSGVDLIAIGNMTASRERTVEVRIGDTYARVYFARGSARTTRGTVTPVQAGVLLDGRPFTKYRFEMQSDPTSHATLTGSLSNQGFSRLQGDAVAFDNLHIALDGADAASPTEIALGDTVGLTLADGPGLITQPGQRQSFVFNVPADQTAVSIDNLYLQGIESTCSEWLVTNLTTGRSFSACGSMDYFDAGDYQIDIVPPSIHNLPYRYAFQLHTPYLSEELGPYDVGATELSFEPDVITGTGPGYIEGSGANDSYTLNVTQAGVLNIDIECLDADPQNCAMETGLYGNGSVSNDRAVDVTPGQYQLLVYGASGPHRYRMHLKIRPVSSTTLALGQTVKPSAQNGLGVISAGHQRERFTFTVANDDTAVRLALLPQFAEVTGPYGGQLVCSSWRLTRVDDGQSYDACLSYGTLPVGTYNLDVLAPPTESLPYSYGFELYEPATTDAEDFPVQPTTADPVIVSPNGADGSGVLEATPSTDTYSFTAAEFGTLNLQLDCDPGDCPTLGVTSDSLGWSSPENTIVRAGQTYRVTVSRGHGGPHSYGLTIAIDPPTAYALGQVATGVIRSDPAGLYRTPYAKLYEFTLAADQTVAVGMRDSNGLAPVIYNATNGSYVDSWGPAVQLAAGDYVAVLGDGGWIYEPTPYEFGLFEVAELPDRALSIGSPSSQLTSTGQLDPGQTQGFTFSVPADGDYFFTESDGLNVAFTDQPGGGLDGGGLDGGGLDGGGLDGGGLDGGGLDGGSLSSPRYPLEAGVYRVVASISSRGVEPLAYTLGLNQAPDVEQFAYNVNETIDGADNDGSGLLEMQAAVDQYNFSLATSQDLTILTDGVGCGAIEVWSNDADTYPSDACEAARFPAYFSAGDYEVRVYYPLGEERPSIAYTMSITDSQPVNSKGSLILGPEAASMAPAVSGTITPSRQVDSYFFTISEDDVALGYNLILERLDGCVDDRILASDGEVYSGSCQSGFFTPQEPGTYELQVSGAAGSSYQYLAYLSAELSPDLFPWTGGT